MLAGVTALLLTSFLVTTTGTQAVAAAAAPLPTYSVQDLGTLPGDDSSVAMGINAAGDVVGWSSGPAGVRAFVYTDGGGMVALPSVPGRPVTTARAINDTGTVVGTASTGGTDVGHAARWQGGTGVDLGTLGTGAFSEARGVNSAGTIVGSSSTDGGGLLGTHAFRYENSTLTDLTPNTDDAHAEAINDAGQIAGSRNFHAARIAGTTVTDLGVPAGFAYSFGSAINASGQVAGHTVSGSGNSERIIRYTDGVGLTILGGLGEFNRAYGINAAGDVVGWGLPVLGLKQGFLYTDANGMMGLNQLTAGSGWFILGAGDINDAGEIAAWATNNAGQHRAVRLVPSATAGTPAAPSGLTAKLVKGRVRLTWTDNATTETGFRVERATSPGGAFVLVADLAANTTKFVDRTARRATFTYRVQAYNAAGSSAWSQTVSITVP